LIFCSARWSNKSGKEKQLCMYNLYPCPPTFFCQMLYYSMCCCSVLP
jgi:hypothetical protein